MNTAAAAFADTAPAHWHPSDAVADEAWLARVSNVLARWLDASRSRQTLDELDERMLRDIGLTRDEARRESNKFFWQR